MDANGYYVFLPAIFIYDDLEKMDFINQMPEQFDRKYFLYPGADGGYMTKYSPGLAILELPFFAAGHWSAHFAGVEKNGYTWPYRLAIAISSIFYSCLGLWILSLVLARYFRKGVVLSTIMLLFLGTNILFYSVLQPAITHNYVFFIVCLLLYFIDRWFKSGNWIDFSLASACVGFSALIRPTEILIGLFVLGMFFAKWKSEGLNASFIQKNFRSLIGGVLGFVVCLLPVFLYWKVATGNWVAYTYEQEGFYFDRPWQIWLGLFGFRKGWFIYTPMLFLAIWGLIIMWKNPQFKGWIQGLIWYLPFNIFIVLSWYGWWYGGCFGLRALIPALAIMAIPLAYLLENQRKYRNLIFAIGVFFIGLNIFQSFQYQRQILHMDAMTWPAYKFIFGKY
jgi:hypothetical protein